MQQQGMGRDLVISQASFTYYDHNVTFIPTLTYVEKDGETELQYILDAYLNGVKLTEKSTTVNISGDCEMSLRRRFENNYLIYIKKIGLRVLIMQLKMTLSISSRFKRANCCDLKLVGLCGGCGDCLTERTVGPDCPMLDSDYPEPDKGVLTIEKDDTQKTLTKKIDETVVSPEVNDDPIIGTQIPGYLLDGIAAGKCVCFADCSALSQDVHLFTGDFMTVEFLVRTCANETCHGTMVSYSGSNRTLAILHLDTIRIVQGDQYMFDTHISLPDLAWSQISLIIDNVNQRGQIYIFRNEDTPEMSEFQLPMALDHAGNLGLGRWQPSADGTMLGELDHFTGCLDQLRIWYR